MRVLEDRAQSFGRLARARDLDPTLHGIDVDDGPDLPGSRGVAELAGVELILLADRGLLRWKRVALHHAPAVLRDRDEFEAGDRRLLVHQRVVQEIAETVVLPPGRLLLAPMPFEQIGEERARPLLPAPGTRVGRDSGDEPRRQLLRHSLALVELGSGGAIGDDRWTRNRGARLDPARAQILEPAAESQRREAVVPVVALDRLPRLLVDRVAVAQLERTLERGPER